jgi:hypothetical protein
MVDRRLTVLIGLVGLLAAAGCKRQPVEPPKNAAAPAPAPKPAVPIPLPKPKLDRQQMIFAALNALSAAALGQADAKAQQGLKGREFEMRLRFGCPDLPADPSRRWSYDEEAEVLRAHISADLSATSVPASDILLKGYEGVAGFTVDRPMLLSAGCPAPEFRSVRRIGGPTIAIAQLFTSKDSRVQRPERTYEITKSLKPNAQPSAGLDLVIAGRLAELPDGRAIHCAAAEGPPVCIVSAKFDRVAIENPMDGTVLGEWSQW